jgi:hypothetical protein
MRVNVSKIACIYWRLFFRIGTFQRVTVDSNKKIPFRLSSRLRLCAKRLKRAFPLFLSPPTRYTRPARSGEWESYNTDFGFWKEIAHKKLWPSDRPATARLIARKDYGLAPPKVEYRLTEAGKSFTPIIASIREWTSAIWGRRPPSCKRGRVSNPTESLRPVIWTLPGD